MPKWTISTFLMILVIFIPLVICQDFPEITIWVLPAGSDAESCGASIEDACSLVGVHKKLGNMTNTKIMTDIDVRVVFAAERFFVSSVLSWPAPRRIILEPSSKLLDENKYIVLEQQISDNPEIPSHYLPTLQLVSVRAGIAIRRINFENFITDGAAALSVFAAGDVNITDCHFRNHTQVSDSSAAALNVDGMPMETRIVNCSWTNCLHVPRTNQQSRRAPLVFASALSYRFQVGDIADPDSFLILKNCTFANNSIITETSPERAIGGAVHIGVSEASGGPKSMRIVIEDSHFSDSGIDVLAESRVTSSTSPPLLRGGALSIASDCPTNTTISNTKFHRNFLRLRGLKSHAVFGGALDVNVAHPESSTTIERSEFVRNYAKAGTGIGDEASAGLCAGGAVNTFANSLLTIRQCTFLDNACIGAYGGLFAGYSQGGALSYKTPPFHDVGYIRPGIRVLESHFARNSVVGSLAPAAADQATASGGALVVTLLGSTPMDYFDIFNSTFEENSCSTQCGRAFGGAIASQFLPLSSAVSLLPYPPINISLSRFKNNYVVGDCGKDAVGKVSLSLGGAMFVSVPTSINSSVILRNSQFNNNSASSLLSAGGAAYFETFLPSGDNDLPPAAGGRFTLDIVDSSLELNNLIGITSATGGAIHVRGVALSRPSVAVRASSFRGNVVTCMFPPPPNDPRIEQCDGGAISVDSSQLKVNFSRFIDNAVKQSTVRRTRPCGSSAGGALSARGIHDTIDVADSSFHFNSVTDYTAKGGAIYAAQLSVRNSSFSNNNAQGLFVAAGGTLFAEIGLVLDKSNISESSAYRGEIDQLCTSSMLFVNGAFGGAIAVSAVERVALSNVLVDGSSSDYGAFIGIGFLPSTGLIKFTDVSVKSLVAHKAGGFLFLIGSNDPLSTLKESCLPIYANKSSVGLYGPVCASPFAELVFHRGFSKFAAPGQQLSVQLKILDAFNNTVVNFDNNVMVSLLASTPPGSLTIRSGEVLDRVKSGRDGIFRFDSFSVLGRSNAMATVRFTAIGFSFIGSPVDSVVTDGTLNTTDCLPSYFSGNAENATDVVCVICPAQSYLLATRECVACPEQPSHGTAHHDSDHYSCLNPPEVHEVSERHNDAGEALWKIPAGYYPIPSLELPEEILACPNGACREFHCQAYVDANSTWALNCSACPTDADRHGELHSSHGEAVWSEDCHCDPGYKDRLCSRCSCNETACYFSAGEPEFRHCTLCRQPSTIVIVVAVIALQLSLVIFLLFKRSAIALLLAELAITVVLFIIGIGEAWMLDLFIMLGLLFVITSLSQRLPRESSASRARSVLDEPTTADEESQSESDVEHLQYNADHSKHANHDGNHHHNHKVAAKTAAIAKITIFFLQSSASIVKPAAWPKWISSVISQLDALNLRVSSIECFAPSLLSNPVAKLAVQLGMPILVGINIFVAAIIAAVILRVDPVGKLKNLFRRCCQRRQRQRRLSDGDEPDPANSLFVEAEKQDEEPLLAQEPRKAHRRSWNLNDLISRVQFSCFFLLSASYFELNNVILEVLRPCYKGYMPNFPWIQCQFSNEYYAGLMGVALLCIFLYTIGIPAFFGAIMLCNRRRILAGDPNMESRFGFLFESYRKELFWWELVWFLRRIMLSIAVSTLVQLPGYQMALILAVLLGTLFLHRSMKPFADKTANILDLSSTAFLIFVIMMGSEIQQHRKTDTTLMTPILQNLVWSLIALMTCFLVLSLVLPALRSLFRHLRNKIRRD